MTYLTRRSFMAGIGLSVAACATPRAASGQDADVLVVGAGISGLHAAHLLEKAGLKVLIVEGSERIGGRAHTLYDLPGSPDAGGVQIGSNYARVIAVAERLGVELHEPPSRGSGPLYHVRGTTLTAEQWPESPANRLMGAERATRPDRLLSSFMRHFPPLAGAEDWMKPESDALDISVRQFVESRGASPEALRLIGCNLNGTDMERLSALHLARSSAVYRQGRGPVRFVRGGTQRLTDAMSAALASPIMTGDPVVAMAEEAGRVRLELASGRRLSSRHVICTAPFSIVRKMRIDAPLSPHTRAMIAELPYTKASFAYLAATEPFWITDGLPHDMWSDHPHLGRIFALGADPAVLKVWINGADAVALDRMPDADAAAAIIARIEAARPSSKGKLSLISMWSWQKQPFARGIYAHLGTGQRAAMAAACNDRAGRLQFAGDHLGRAYSGFEGAMESGEDAVRAVLARA